MTVSSHPRPLFVLVLVFFLVRLSESLVFPSKEVSRRTWFGQVTCALITTTAGVAQPAFAATTQDDKDKANILKGYQRLNHLLDNWDDETTICKTGNDNPYLGCDRTPVKIMEYLGYKNTGDPLFKADKTMLRLSELVPAKFEEEYQDAMDTWIEKSEEGSGMAYISSWGESNPGGGKDRVEMFIERSKTDVTQCRDSLGTVIRVLGL